MKKNKVDKKFGRLVVISLFIMLLTMSVVQAVVKPNIGSVKLTVSPNTKGPLAENYFTWEDEFTDATKIDPTMSYNYELSSGVVKMRNTYQLWTDTAWTRLKPITVTNSAGESLYNYAVQLTINYDSDMRSDYGDLRFKHQNSGDVYLNYWIENYDSSSANVWVKIPYLSTGTSTLYLFYGNPSATSQSNFYSVFTEWEEAWPNDEQVTYHSNNEGGWDPDVAYGNGEFLIAWEEGQAYWPPYTWGFKQEIRASIYDISGNRLVFDNLVYQDSTTYYRNENPSIDYGGGKYFVAWEHYDTVANPSATTMDIKARTVTRSGSSLQLGSVITVCSAADCQADANVQFDSANTRFCVVWEDARSGETNYNIYGRLYDTNGNPVGSEKNICTAANSQCEPWVAFDPVHAQYMVVWEEGITGNNGPFSIKAGLFDANLNQIGNTITIATGTDSTDYNYPCVEFCPETQRFLVTYNDDDISGGDYWGNVWGKIYDAAGNLLYTFAIKTGDFVRTDIVPYLGTSFFVSFNSKSPSGESGLIWGKLVSSDGVVFTGDVQLSASTSAEADWANMAVGNGKICVAWEDIRVFYPSPWNGMPDAYCNIWNLNIPTGSEVTYSVGEEKELILAAQLTSIEIAPENLLAWHDFNADFDGTITFDILDGTGNTVLIEGISPEQLLQSINPIPAIRLRAHYTRSNPSYTPTLDSWIVRYIGQDLVAPVTELDHIVGQQGLKSWYTSESVTVWLHSYDLPEGTGSGVNHTYYTLNSGPTEEYIVGSGLPLVVTQEASWTGIWDVNFWSVDRSGNEEDKTKPGNTIQIKIDAERPYVEITEPADEQKVQVPFWIRADASDNAVVDRVEFDIEPFGQNPGLPYVDTEAPYEWLCNVGDSYGMQTTSGGDAQPAGVNKMIRAQVFDESGQTWISEKWIFIKSSGESSIEMSSQSSSQMPGSQHQQQQQGSTPIYIGQHALIRQILGLK